MIRTVVHGAGRMARSVLAQLPGYGNLEPVALVSRTQPDDCPGIDWFASLEELQSDADLMIDFNRKQLDLIKPVHCRVAPGLRPAGVRPIT